MKTLADLTPGTVATVTGFAEAGPVAQRMMELGVLEGESLRVVRFAPAGDPIEIEILGYALSLRRSEALLVRVSLGDGEAAPDDPTRTGRGPGASEEPA